MNKPLSSMVRLSATVAVMLLFLQAVPSTASGRGLYLDLPSWFQRADTAGVRLAMSEAFIMADDYDASMVGLAIPFNFNSRTSAVVSMHYPIIHRSGGFKHGFADGAIDIVTRVAGDSLNSSGLFLRADIRVPIGSGSLYPFAYRSADGGIYPDVGAGLEYRKELPIGRLRCSATYTVAGQNDDSDDPLVADFFTGGLALDISAGSKTFVRLGFFGIDYKGPGFKESYLVAIDRSLSRQLRLVITGAIDAGDDRDRVFDSILQMSLEFDFNAARE